MANTYTQLFVHSTFSVKDRKKLILPGFKVELYKYISGIIRNKKHKLYAIGGIENHIHVFVSMKPDISVSEMIKELKMNSTNWINDRKFLKTKFEWQEGFGAFTYSKSQAEMVCKYILNQENHHKKMTFEEEYKKLLEKFGVEYDTKYLF
jgi:REP element-mobilizing transposase RayT